MNRYIFFLLTFFIISCQYEEHEGGFKGQMKFNLYDSSDHIVKEKAFLLRFYNADKSDSIVIVTNNNTVFNIIQIFDSVGIHRFCNGKFITTHLLSDTLINDNAEKYCKLFPPFQNKNVSFRGSKIYEINKEEYTVLHFIEDNGVDSKTYDNYYLKGMGPICCYSFDSDDYILCDSLSGFTVDSKTIKAITTKLLKDTSFFSKFFLRKQFPNFHRPAY